MMSVQYWTKVGVTSPVYGVTMAAWCVRYVTSQGAAATTQRVKVLEKTNEPAISDKECEDYIIDLIGAAAASDWSGTTTTGDLIGGASIAFHSYPAGLVQVDAIHLQLCSTIYVQRLGLRRTQTPVKSHHKYHQNNSGIFCISIPNFTRLRLMQLGTNMENIHQILYLPAVHNTEILLSKK